MMSAQKLSSRQTFLLIAFCGLAIEIAIVAWLMLNPSLTRLCKAVVPQVIVELHGAEKLTDGKSLFVQYKEYLPNPLNSRNMSPSARISSCTIVQGHCTGDRARYELRPEPSRTQSLSVFLIDGKRHAAPSTVTWSGPSYPDRVTMRCSMDKDGQPKGCKLVKLDYRAERSNAHEDKAEAANRRHDQCQPTLSRLFHGTAED
jgi:hypothetical protein